jgi:ATP phosphoribosyltransferase
LVAGGYYDLGISGYDWYLESDYSGNVKGNVKATVDLGFGRVDVVLAVPAEWDDVDSAGSLFHKFRRATSAHPLRIWTEYLNLTEDLVLKYEAVEPTVISPYARVWHMRHSSVQIFHSFGATESKPPEDGEAIVDNTETGRTLRANGLKVVHKLLPGSTAHLLVNSRALQSPEKQDLIDLVVTKCEKAVPQQARRPKATFGGHIDW